MQLVCWRHVQAKRNPKLYGMPTDIQNEPAFEAAMHQKFTLAFTEQLSQHGLVRC